MWILALIQFVEAQIFFKLKTTRKEFLIFNPFNYDFYINKK